MQLGVNKDEAELILYAILYYMKNGGIKYLDLLYPNADLNALIRELETIIECLEEK